ncbi:PRC-barrel domain protein [Hasllibacter halocynthiae]|uniref:PRC-barrel domain protein n=1 Tax=Hasllibacter halocynthiae TaxID=595589 RepID=A0A2T0X9Y4_9RHOB|nr:PRC-barrel domain-containing protein [Hasllibacter halocynthiae]PRY95761.1 PRC-barrel domain protein [Hasllibacter halocynthiae]
MRIALTTLAAAAVALPALAQDVAPNLLEVENEALVVEPWGITVDDLEDTDIEDASGDVIGEVDEVLMTPEGEIVAVSAEVGGFLGIGDSEVVVELGMLRPEGDRLHIDMSKEQIEALPVWDD